MSEGSGSYASSGYGQPGLVACFKGHQANVLALAFNPNGKHLASSASDGSIMLWNLTSSKNSLRYISGKTPVTSIDFSPSGDLMASSQGNCITLWIPTVKGKCSDMKCHSTRIRSVQFSPDGQTLVTASNDKTIKIWNTATRKFVSSLTGHTHWVRMARYSNDGRLVVSCSEDKTVKIWDPRANPSIVQTFVENRGVPNYAEFHPSDSFVGVGMMHNVVKLYEMRSRSLLQYYMCHSDQVTSLSFHPLGHFLLSASNDSTARVIDLVEGRALCTLQFDKGSQLSDIAFSKCGRHFATASADKTVRMWKTNMDAVQKKVNTAHRDLRMSMSANCDNSTSFSVTNNNHDKAHTQIDDSHVQDVYCPQDYEEDDNDQENDGVNVGFKEQIADNHTETNGGLRNKEENTTGEANVHSRSGQQKGCGKPTREDCGSDKGENSPRDCKELLSENEMLRRENCILKEKLALLEDRLFQYENKMKILESLVL